MLPWPTRQVPVNELNTQISILLADIASVCTLSEPLNATGRQDLTAVSHPFGLQNLLG